MNPKKENLLNLKKLKHKFYKTQFLITVYLLHLNLVLSIQDNGQKVWDKDGVNKYGQINLFMKENGLMIKHVVEVNWYMLMEIFMKENGKMINNMGELCSNYQMEKLHMANGKMAFVSIEILLIICKKLFPSLSS